MGSCEARPKTIVTPTLDPNSQRDPLDLLAEEMVERFRRGEEPCVDDYIKKYPHLAEQIRQTLPAVLMLERLKPLTEKTGADKEAGRVEPQLERIGDYRIVREIGRGGMGIVYEAEQRSLARRVALKILPHATALTGQNLRRFELEARAAARLLTACA